MDNKRLFFALWPSHRQREAMRDAINPALSIVEGATVDRRNWHVTLVFLGEFPGSRVDDLLTAVRPIRPAELRLRFDALTYWPKSKVACVQARTVPPELQDLIDALERAVQPFGIEPESRTYRPHITVARRARAFADTPLARPLELTWSEFELVESTTVRGEVHYSPLKQ